MCVCVVVVVVVVVVVQQGGGERNGRQMGELEGRCSIDVSYIPVPVDSDTPIKGETRTH